MNRLHLPNAQLQQKSGVGEKGGREKGAFKQTQ